MVRQTILIIRAESPPLETGPRPPLVEILVPLPRPLAIAMRYTGPTTADLGVAVRPDILPRAVSPARAYLVDDSADRPCTPQTADIRQPVARALGILLRPCDGRLVHGQPLNKAIRRPRQDCVLHYGLPRRK